ncbi:thioredoxin family protein [Thiocapsa sp.]|uniref:thioredoxin family protein n=1 Tax=Thiocapsa sp. TaxID=2024551 RepID=UPI002C25D652|nr:thioredoxin fold domain-containing protein [Thiocapsa sp.]HSO82080.1 thioredoxin fold domain-containing protein [Thiocapsa sp.]
MFRLPAAFAFVFALGLLAGSPTAIDGAKAQDMSPADDSVYSFDDFPREDLLEHPDWFKTGFLDLPSDLEEAIAEEKQGLIVYFGQKHCAYCHKLLNENFGLSDILEYTQRHFDLVAIDVWGVEEVTTIDGEVMTEREFSVREDTNFTPSLLFYDAEGKLALRLRGYYPPYQFRAALEYVADGHYARETFRDYLARGENRMVFEPEDLNEQPFFAKPPYNLDRRFPSERPLAVFFEQGDCHACDVLHGQALKEPAITGYFGNFDSVQLDMWSDTPVVTPSGERTTARAWAEQLGLFYAPSILFFDERGKELLRVDSVVRFYRLRNVLNYISSKAYLTESFGEWRLSEAL